MPSLGPAPDPQLDLLPITPPAAPLQFGPADEGRAVSAEAFAAARFEPPYTYERTAGRLRVMSPEGKEHVRTTNPWLSRLFIYQGANPDIVQAVVPGAWIVVDGLVDRIADIGVYLGGSLSSLDIPRQMPDLVFEVVSPSREDRHRDYVAKRAEYEQIGVREYVIIDRVDRRVTVLTLADGHYAERIIEAGSQYQSPLLPGLVITLDEVGLI